MRVVWIRYCLMVKNWKERLCGVQYNLVNFTSLHQSHAVISFFPQPPWVPVRFRKCAIFTGWILSLNSVFHTFFDHLLCSVSDPDPGSGLSQVSGSGSVFGNPDLETDPGRQKWHTVQGGSDISGTLSKLHRSIKNTYFSLILSRQTVSAVFKIINKKKKTHSGQDRTAGSHKRRDSLRTSRRTYLNKRLWATDT